MKGSGMGGEVKIVLVFSLVFLFAPVAVLGQVTLFLENFDDPELTNWTDQGGGRVPLIMEYATFTANNGYGFLNLSGIDPAEIAGTSDGFKVYSARYFHYVGLEMGIRLSSDNKQESDVGGGARRWGFRSGAVQWALSFRTLEEGMLPASEQWWGPGNPQSEWLGFGVGSRINDEFSFWQRIEGIDLTQWHTYTILWEPEVATFLIDGVVVAMTKEVPQEPMRIYLRAAAGQNLALPCQMIGEEEVCTDEYMQVDYVRVFIPDERFQEMDSEISGLLTQARSLISQLDQENQNTTHLMTEYGKAQADWQKDYYSYDDAKPRLERIIEALEHWDEITAMFAQAHECIEILTEKGDTRNENMCRAFYSNALGTWEECAYDSTRSVLSNIITKCPEPLLLTLLGLVLLPAFLRERK